ncbi:MAG: hypothetical protein NVSMB14_03130 [Isosphaeraceae bacterium]
MLLPVLIEVPALGSRLVGSRPRASLRPIPRKRARRRLKREVRAAVAAILILTPGLGAGNWFVRVAREWKTASLTARPSPTTTPTSLATGETLSVEVDTDGRQLHGPAVQPGVVVPVYGPEEDSDHAGS